MADGEKRALPSASSPDESVIRRHRVLDLFGGQREVILEHDGHDYRLRITSNGKLILTK